MVALFRFFEPVKVSAQFLLGSPTRTVNPLELWIVRITAPIGAGELQEFERLAKLSRRRQVRPGTQVEPIALTVNGDVLFCGDRFHMVRFKGLAGIPEMLHRRIPIPDLADDLFVPVDDLLHALFHHFEIVGRERRFAIEIVIEAVFGCGPECDLRVGEKLLYGFGKDMGGVMAQQFQRVFMVAGHDLHSGVGFDRAREIAQFAIDLDRKRGFGEARTDIRGERRARHRAVEISDTAVRECNRYHQTLPCRLRDGEERTCLAQGQFRFNLFDADIR